MIPTSPWRRLAALALALGSLNGSGAAEGGPPPPQLEVRFTEEGVALSGAVDSEETLQSLAAAVKSVRPDLAVVDDGIDIDPEAGISRPGEIESVLAELGLSTHEGRLVIREDRVLIGGSTDSLVTSTALRIRLEPLLEDRRLIDRICIVNSEDMPEIPVSLTRSDEPEEVDLEARSAQGPSFHPPGLAIEQIYPMVLMLSDLRRLEGEGNPDRPPEPLRAIPMSTSSAGGASSPQGEDAEAGAEPVLQAMPAAPVERRATLQPVRFARNSVLLQAGQRAVLDRVAGQLRDESLAGQPVTLSPVLSEDGPDAFAAYLGERRGKEVEKRLAERGVDVARLSVEPVSSDSRIDRGEVRVSVKLPEPEPEPEPGEDGEEGPDAADEPTPSDSPRKSETAADREPSPAPSAGDRSEAPEPETTDSPETDDPDSRRPYFRLRADDPRP